MQFTREAACRFAGNTSLYLLRMKQIRFFEATRGDLLIELRCLGYILEMASNTKFDIDISDKTGLQSGELVDDPQATVPIYIPTKEVWRNCFDC